MAKYSIGIDFGSLSVRTLLIDIETGQEVSSAEYCYSHAELKDRLPGGAEIPAGWALQDPMDYLNGLRQTIREVVNASKVDVCDIVGIGLDFTSNTFLPIDKNGTPLCFDKNWENDPNAWVKMWKHNSTNKYAEIMQNTAVERNEEFIKYYGENISPAWMLPRLLEVLEEDPELYHAADRFIEAGDWIVMQLTGKEARSASMAGFKAFWNKKNGYPSKEYFAAVNPSFENVIDSKLSRSVHGIGKSAGKLGEKGIELTGLSAATSVAVANIDAHASMVPFQNINSGDILLVIGTSTCHLMICSAEADVPGVCGIVEDGIVPGFWGYEFGQNCVGDCFKWFVNTMVPESYYKAAKAEGLDIHQYLSSLAAKQKPGENGLVALDWWNGNRSVLCNFDLTGLIVGLNLNTKPEDIYRSLIEATAFGSRRILESLQNKGLPVNNVYACGGIASKNPFLMQIYADILKKDIHTTSSKQMSALGSAIWGAVAAGEANGGYGSVKDAVENMGVKDKTVYHPDPSHSRDYDELYGEFLKLHDFFGIEEKGIMERLRLLKNR